MRRWWSTPVPAAAWPSAAVTAPLAWRRGTWARPTARSSLVAATVRHALAGARRSYGEPGFLAAGEFWLRTDPPCPLVIDGEIYGRTPVRITLAPNALRVMVAPGFPDA